jgi:hydrogenase large subunit
MAAYETQGFKLDNSGRRIVVDPVTRIEGHMRCEVNLDKDNVIRNAVSTGTMWRGLEFILRGRDPRDAACAPAATRWPACARWKTLWASRSRRTRT